MINSIFNSNENNLSQRKIICLDQNYIIYFSDVILGRCKQNYELYSHLLDNLITAIFNKQVVICPYNDLTEVESLHGFDRAPKNMAVGKLLSNGWDFIHWSRNLTLQLLCNIAELNNKPAPWNLHLKNGKPEMKRLSLKSNRHGGFVVKNTDDLKFHIDNFIKHRPIQLPVSNYVNLQKELNNLMKQVKKSSESTQEHAISLIDWFMYNRRNFDNIMDVWLKDNKPDLNISEKDLLIDLTYNKKYPPPIPQELANHPYFDFSKGDDNFIADINNTTNHELPFVKIWATLFAFYQKNKDMKSKASTIYDFLRIASTMPSCDIYCTDNEMQTSLRDSGLEKEYQLKVYGGGNKSIEDLIEEINKL